MPGAEAGQAHACRRVSREACLLNLPLYEGLLCVRKGAVPHVAIVVEALLHVRPDGQPHTKERFQCLSQHVRTGVPEGLRERSAAQSAQISEELLHFLAIQPQQLHVQPVPCAAQGRSSELATLDHIDASPLWLLALHIVCSAAEVATHLLALPLIKGVEGESAVRLKGPEEVPRLPMHCGGPTAALDRLLLMPLAMSMGVVTSLTPSFTDPSGSVTLMGACSSLAFWSCNIHCSPDTAPVWSKKGTVQHNQGLRFT